MVRRRFAEKICAPLGYPIAKRSIFRGYLIIISDYNALFKPSAGSKQAYYLPKFPPFSNLTALKAYRLKMVHERDKKGTLFLLC